jgi:hypothetical protein
MSDFSISQITQHLKAPHGFTLFEAYVVKKKGKAVVVVNLAEKIDYLFEPGEFPAQTTFKGDARLQMCVELGTLTAQPPGMLKTDIDAFQSKVDAAAEEMRKKLCRFYDAS